MKRWWGLALVVLAAAAQAEDLAPADFQWRATLDTDGHGGLVRVPLPGDALGRLQSRFAADLRVFDASGEPVAFALSTPAQPPENARAASASFAALPLNAARPGKPLPKGAVTMRVENGAQSQSVWVQLGAPGSISSTDVPQGRLPAALFDTRKLQQPITALVLQAQLPANVPVEIRASSSEDLASWTPVPLRGRVYRFEGEGAPANDRLELAEPLKLEGRFLRLDWSGQDGVAVQAVHGLLAATRPARQWPALALGAGQPDGANAREWQLPFATPIAQLEVATPQANTLLPLRILGRNQVSEPWHPLGQMVVYRLGAAGAESSNPPAVLAHPSVRWLRLEATHGARLQGVPLAVRALFDPVDVVFAAGGATPYQLVAGRAQAPQAALPLGVLAATTSTRIEDLPLARITQASATPAEARPAWLPRGLDRRSAGLWAVLLLGVVVLGGVAWSLLRQLRQGPAG